MKKKNLLLTFFVLMLCTPSLAIAVFAACAAGKSYVESYRNCFDYNYNDDTFYKIAVFTKHAPQRHELLLRDEFPARQLGLINLDAPSGRVYAPSALSTRPHPSKLCTKEHPR